MSAVQGNRSHDATDRGAPIKVGGKAVGNTVPTDVADGDRVDAWYDVQGALVTDPRGAEWIESASALSSAGVTVSHASTSGETHYLTSLTVSYRASVRRLVDIYFGATKQFGVYTGVEPLDIEFDRPIKVTQSNAVTLIAASGNSASGDLEASIRGYTKDD